MHKSIAVDAVFLFSVYYEHHDRHYFSHCPFSYRLCPRVGAFCDGETGGDEGGGIWVWISTTDLGQESG